VTRLDESKNCIVVNDYNATIGSYEGMMQDMLGIQPDSGERENAGRACMLDAMRDMLATLERMAITTRPVGVRS
jgi:hypothetical protein